MSQLTNQQILEQAIRLAIDGGWQGLPGRPTEDLLTFVEGTDYCFIFSHDFAKALWPGVHYEDETSYPAFEYHLQQMVIAEDPIKYLGANI